MKRPYTDLYSVPLVLARYRVQPQQKMALDPKEYYHEIDDFVSGAKVVQFLRRLAATRMGRKAIRLYFKVKRRHHLVEYDARRCQWTLKGVSQ